MNVALGLPLFTSMAVCLIAGKTACAQMSCSTTGGGNVPMRAEGLAEFAGDFIITCVNGVSTAAGIPVRAVDIRISLNTLVMSKKLAGSICGASGDVEPNAGVCTITGTGTGAGVYTGAAGRPNVFQGFQESSNAILWSGVPIDPPGARLCRVVVEKNVGALERRSTLNVSLTAKHLIHSE
jgi:hypothetical protein